MVNLPSSLRASKRTCSIPWNDSSNSSQIVTPETNTLEDTSVFCPHLWLCLLNGMNNCWTCVKRRSGPTTVVPHHHAQIDCSSALVKSFRYGTSPYSTSRRTFCKGQLHYRRPVLISSPSSFSSGLSLVGRERVLRNLVGSSYCGNLR